MSQPTQGNDRPDHLPAFSGKRVIVTGAGSGIGRASVMLFAAAGAQVVAVDASDNVFSLPNERACAGGKVLALKMDAGSDVDVRRMVAAAIETFGGIDVVHANAGISGGMAGLFEQTAEDWAHILRVNLIGPALAIQHAAAAMSRGGSIICTASVAGLRSGAGGPAYSASKAGVINLVQTAAQQLSGAGVRVNAVCPGLIETGMTHELFERARAAGKADRIGQLNPLRRGGLPEEIARAVLFLASDAASYINGHALVVDGGLSASLPVRRQEFGKTAL